MDKLPVSKIKLIHNAAYDVFKAKDSISAKWLNEGDTYLLLSDLTMISCCQARDIRFCEDNEYVFDGQYWQLLGTVVSLELVQILIA